VDEDRSTLSAAMDRYAGGDDDAFGAVYDLLAPRLYAFFLRHTSDGARSEDLVQQTLLQMHAARSSYVRASDVVPWAFCIGRRLLIDSRRRTKKEQLFESAADEAAALDARIERFDVPDRWVMTKELAAEAREALDNMPEQHRTAFLLIRRDGLSVGEAAEIVGTTPSAIKLRAYRAYEALRTALTRASMLVVR
jgi:RNA polymerase sigma-70 factor (ECF subfamily)